MNNESHNIRTRAVGRFENPRGVSSNVVGIISQLVRVGLTDLLFFFWGGGRLCPPVPTALMDPVKVTQIFSTKDVTLCSAPQIQKPCAKYHSFIASFVKIFGLKRSTLEDLKEFTKFSFLH